jgi:hemoglobin-like flavoprotein
LPERAKETTMVSPVQIQLVQTSWQRLLPIQNEVARLFYDRLFELDPGVRALFPAADMREQGRKLTAMITTAVNGLSRLETIVPAVRDLGRRHSGYGVTDAHYDTVAAGLIWTLEQGLGDSFTQPVREAWIEVYDLLSSVMKKAASVEIA